MAVYRSDQAQFTYGTEHGQGGRPELASNTTETSSGYSTTMSSAASPGDRQISVAAVPTATGTVQVGDFIRIGNEANNSQIRRVEKLDSSANVLFLDVPLAFPVVASQEVKEVDSVTAAANDQLIHWVPGVYETVDVPDPEMSIEGRRLLGESAKRNFGIAYSGQQSYSGSVGGFVLLDGTPLRFPIGNVQTAAFQSDNSDAIAAISGNPTATASKGDIFCTTSSGTNISADDILVFGYIGSSQVMTNATTQEIRRVVSKSSDEIRLDYPLNFAHSSVTLKKVTSLSYYKHLISETTNLDTLSWNIKMVDTDESNEFTRSYYGGMIDSATLTGEEGGLVSYSWDTVPFMGMVHNQGDYEGVTNDLTQQYPGGPAASELPFFHMMQTIGSGAIGNPLTVGSGSVNKSFATTEPYYFSQGELKMHGITFARVRSFSLGISNGVEPRYYVKPIHGRHRGPNELREQAREYSFSCTIASEDSAAGTSTAENANALFKELILEGDYGTPSAANKAGIDIVLTFERGTNDKIVVTVPDDGSATKGLNEQGAFITSANHSIDGNNPIQADVNMVFRNMKIEVFDTLPVYP
tara:strand:+ start:33 stop:1781 length:1749 start_codon:yes stop_codon:yes gene_type:complete